MAEAASTSSARTRRSVKLNRVPAEDDEVLDDSFVIGERRRTKETTRKSILHNNADQNNKFSAAYEKLTAGEKEQHYELCIKLAEENKITPKNVFGLHLINYMTDFVAKSGDNPNFQVAGMTLQASTKIYSLRVDTLHHELMQMSRNLASCESSKDDNKRKLPQADATDDVIPGESSEDQTRARPPKKKKKKQILDFSGKSFLTSHIPTQPLPPPKCSIFSKVLERHRGRQRLLFQLSVASDKCDVVLSNPSANQPEKKKYNLDIAKTKPKELIAATLFSNVSNTTEASQTIEDFSFLASRWPLDANDELEQIDQSEVESIFEIRNQTLPDLNDMPNVTVVAPPDEPEDVSDPVVFDMAERDSDNLAASDEMPMQRESSFTEESEHDEYMPPSPAGSRLSVADVSQCLSQNPDDYRTLDLDLEKCLLMGRNILKAKPAMGKNVQAPKRDRPKKKPLICEFSQESYATSKKLCVRGKGKHITPKSAMSKWPEQHEDCFEETDDFQLMEPFVLPAMPMDDDENESHSEGDQGENDLVMDDGASAQHSFEGDNFGADHFPPVFDSSDSGIRDSDVRESDTHIIPLVPLPPKVKKDVISYAKISKKIDIKLIKGAMWGTLCETGPEISYADYSIRMNEPQEFKKVYDSVKTKLPEETRDDVSVSVAFVVLLQLANEHNLKIESLRRGKLLISQPD